MRACVEEVRAYDEEGADSQSLDLRAQWVEEGLTEECEEEERLEEEEEVEVEVEVEAIDSGSEWRSSADLTLDQKTFLIMQKSLNTKYPDIVQRWSARFTRRPPSRSTVKKILKRAREENSIQSRKHNSGRKRTVRTPAIIEEVKRRIDE